MKTIIVGDTHGRSWWKLISQKETWDKFIFIGDYWDSFDISYNYQRDNFREILDFKRENPDKVILLFGNHDYHYMGYAMNEVYSGFQQKYGTIIKVDLEEALREKLLQMCHIDGKFCFTHAGITNTWLESQEFYPKKMSEKRGLEIFINELFIHKPLAFRFNGRDSYGDNITQSPIWVRPASLKQDMVKGYCHVVGHTQVKKINLAEDMILIDALEQNQEYLVIEDDKVSVKEVDRL